MAGNPLAGTADAVFNQVAGVIGNDVPEFRLIFRRGAFNRESLGLSGQQGGEAAAG